MDERTFGMAVASMPRPIGADDYVLWLICSHMSLMDSRQWISGRQSISPLSFEMSAAAVRVSVALVLVGSVMTGMLGCPANARQARRI